MTDTHTAQAKALGSVADAIERHPITAPRRWTELDQVELGDYARHPVSGRWSHIVQIVRPLVGGSKLIVTLADGSEIHGGTTDAAMVVPGQECRACHGGGDLPMSGARCPDCGGSGRKAAF